MQIDSETVIFIAQPFNGKKKPATLRCGLKSKPVEVLEETIHILLHRSKLSPTIFVYQTFSK